MFKKISLFIAIMAIFYGCSGTDEGPVKSLADLEKRVSKLNAMNSEMEKQKTDLYSQIRQFNASLPESQQFDITIMDTLMGAPERELLRGMFREEKDISYNGLLKTIIAKNDQLAELQQKISNLEAKMPKAYSVKRGDTHYQIVMHYLMTNQGMTKTEAHRIAWKTALIDDILPGNRIWLMYENGLVGSFVTQGDAKISPMKVIMMAKKRMLEKGKIISSLENRETNIAGN